MRQGLELLLLQLQLPIHATLLQQQQQQRLVRFFRVEQLERGAEFAVRVLRREVKANAKESRKNKDFTQMQTNAE